MLDGISKTTEHVLIGVGMIRMSKGFEKHWHNERVDEVLDEVVLQPRLAAIVNAPLMREKDCLVWEPLFQPGNDPKRFYDKAAFEAFTNKIYLDDYIDTGDEFVDICVLVRQGVKAAMVLAKRLKEHGVFRVLLSLDSDIPSMSLGFFLLRTGEKWGPDDPNDYKNEDVLMIEEKHQ